VTESPEPPGTGCEQRFEFAAAGIQDVARDCTYFGLVPR
jgi:hypothetical protein